MSQGTATPACVILSAMLWQLRGVQSYQPAMLYKTDGPLSLAIGSKGDLALDAPGDVLPVSSSSLARKEADTSLTLTMPRVGFGTCGKCNGPGLEKAFVAFLNEGGRMFDTAAMYGNHKQLGSLVKASGVPREELFIIDKIDPHRFDDPKFAERQIDLTLQDFETEYVDLMLIHGPWGPLGSTEKGREILWKTLIEAQKKGKVKNIGVSNFNRTMIEALSKATGVWPAASEFEYHPWVRPYVKDFAQWCRNSGIQVIAYGSLGTGGFSGIHPAAVDTAANNHLSSPSSVLLRWALDQGAVVIPSSGNAEHIRSNLRLASLSDSFQLSMEERSAIELERRPQGWRRCTLANGCFTNDLDDGPAHDLAPTVKATPLLRSVGSWLSRKLHSFHSMLWGERSRECTPRTTDFTADTMDRIRESVIKHPELKPLIVRNHSRGLGLIVMDSFLSSQEVQDAVKDVMSAKFVDDAMYERGHADANLKSPEMVRFNCNKAETPETIRGICRKVVSTLGTESRYLEPDIGVRVYERDEFVKHHNDQAPPHQFEFCGKRTLTALIHLGDAEGGGTHFFDMKDANGTHTVGVKPGRAVIFANIDGTVERELDPNIHEFHSAPVHEGEPVKSGKKILMTLWFRQFDHAKAMARGCCETTNPYPSLMAKHKACSCL